MNTDKTKLGATAAQPETDEADLEGFQWLTFLEEWERTLGGQRFTISAIIEAMRTNPSFGNTLPEMLAPGYREEAATFRRQFQNALHDRRLMPFGPRSIRLVFSVDGHTKQKLWKVVTTQKRGGHADLWLLTGAGL